MGVRTDHVSFLAEVIIGNLLQANLIWAVFIR